MAEIHICAEVNRFCCRCSESSGSKSPHFVSPGSSWWPWRWNPERKNVFFLTWCWMWMIFTHRINCEKPECAYIWSPLGDWRQREKALNSSSAYSMDRIQWMQALKIARGITVCVVVKAITVTWGWCSTTRLDGALLPDILPSRKDVKILITASTKIA